MSGMDQFLANFYGTNASEKTASAEDLEKEASVELFMKLASEQNIDLANMPDQQVQALYNSWVEKSAQAQGGQPAAQTQKTAGEDEDKKKREEAEKEHGEKKAAAEKIAEADFLGRVMAHSYAQELRKIAAAQNGEGAKTAGEMPEAFRKALDAKKGEGGDEKKDDKEEKKDDKKEASAASSKKASAIDELALHHAVKIAQAGGFDPAQAARKVAAVAELGLLGESTKVASAATVDGAVEVRALEFLEAAGYPVTWNQQ